MSIVQSEKSKRITRLQGLAGAALMSSAVFMAAPKVARAEVDLTATGNQDWFNTAVWFETTTSGTGSLPEQFIAGNVTNAVNLDANNATLPSVGVLFDPANDSLTPGGANANYIAQMGLNTPPGDTTFYVGNATNLTNFTSAAPNKLTIESGTMELAVVTLGRDGTGVIVQNGGTLITDQKLAIQGENHTQTIGSGTFEYHGGTYIAGNQVQVATGNTTGSTAMGNTSAGVGRFVVYNDGADGAVLITNGFSFATNTGDKGTIGIVEFHYDADPGALNPGVRPVQDDFNTTNGSLKLTNGTNTSSRLNLVLDTSPGTIVAPTNPNAEFINLGLFKTQSITGAGTFPKLFYTLTSGTTAYTQGATVSAAFSGNTYSWTISYSGVISFDNTATSAYTSEDISATGGTDVVLLGVTPVVVPEPASLAILGGAGSMMLARRRRQKKA
jgi:hypothetical protein